MGPKWFQSVSGVGEEKSPKREFGMAPKLVSLVLTLDRNLGVFVTECHSSSVRPLPVGDGFFRSWYPGKGVTRD